MATVINNPNSPAERIVERDSGSSAGWAVAVIILIAVIAGFIWYFGTHRASPAPASGTPSANIQVNLPGATASGSGNEAPPSSGSANGSY